MVIGSHSTLTPLLGEVKSSTWPTVYQHREVRRREDIHVRAWQSKPNKMSVRVSDTGVGIS